MIQERNYYFFICFNDVTFFRFFHSNNKEASPLNSYHVEFRVMICEVSRDSVGNNLYENIEPQTCRCVRSFFTIIKIASNTNKQIAVYVDLIKYVYKNCH